jgi:hypothetical protein
MKQFTLDRGNHRKGFSKRTACGVRSDQTKCDAAVAEARFMERDGDLKR